MSLCQFTQLPPIIRKRQRSDSLPQELSSECPTKRRPQASRWSPSLRIHKPAKAPIPDIVIMQAHLKRANIYSVLDQIDAGSLQYEDAERDALALPDRMPLVLFTFTYNNRELLSEVTQLLSRVTCMRGVLPLGVTPSSWTQHNPLGFNLLLDKKGLLAKKLRVLDPLGGGKYPLNCILIFDRLGEEVARIKLGYDRGIYYGNGKPSLEQVLSEVVGYVTAQ